MCRLLAYKGIPIVLTKVLFEPKNSLVNQSFGAKEIEEPLNGDGFGVGWYAPDLSPEPAVFVSTTPAWSNLNLKTIAPRIKSGCIFAHVRAASVGGTAETNCHPFHFGRFMLMHNGGIGGFAEIKRKLRRGLSDVAYNWIKGETDTQHLFAVFIDKMLAHGENYTPQDLVDALVATINDIEAMKVEAGSDETSYLNVVVSDGNTIVGTRFISSSDEEALSLYYSTGSRYVCEGGVCRMVETDESESSAMIVSEKLTDLQQDWRKVPQNHLVVIDEKNAVTVQPIRLNTRLASNKSAFRTRKSS